MKKYLIPVFVIALAVGATVAFGSKVGACGFWDDCPSTNSTEQQSLEANMEKLVKADPIPSMQQSLERSNIAKRAQLFNAPDKISYIYLISYGKVMAFYTVKGKVTSLNSYMTPQERLINSYGNGCNGSTNCYAVSAPDIDGSYGTNANGVFFFTTEGAYVEWKGEYMMSDQPLQLSTPPEMVRQVK